MRGMSPDQKYYLLSGRGELSPSQRINYTNAVLCLQNLPNQVPTADYPGVRSRFDDFVATHINYTLHTHYSDTGTGHCGQATLPQAHSSMAVRHPSPVMENTTQANKTCLAGTSLYSEARGGGCAKSGPFKDMKVHMGPFPGSLTSLTEIPAPRFEYNPRCLNRSLNDFVSSRYTNSTLVSTLMKTSKIADFQMVLDHWPPREDGVLGLHGGGHFSIGSTMQDLFGSSQDPAFFLHHSQIDRLWAKWQDVDANRRNALNGTSTILNPPSADPVTLETIMDFGYLDSPRPVHEVMSPLANGFSYVYT
ncbi:N-acetyl-6-hydroxytryptophan oxidase ivoB [Penicillium maclennaniae]|uniref:N-acetyl-6-hydroxytryptophan oxidase ivoB n=1 Tax=Penicillium maclennaniae TaxID=1343394 RepID=UPI0025425A76|nr:N-acetyl-6-hydroxytryptophan oxidase ivoB [Penicillium maclennaniae]KAJ5683691.1 N-acetyl-6-hydroxytryptophan oxidase ivoB [Penicillium maclennaniae]